MPKLVHFSHRLLQLTAVWDPPNILTKAAKSTEYVCMLSVKKVKGRQHYIMLKGSALATNQTKNTL